MPVMYDNIFTSSNDVFHWLEGTTTLRATVPSGNYDIDTLVAEVTAVITADVTITGTYVMSHSNGFVTFARTDATTTIQVVSPTGGLPLMLGWPTGISTITTDTQTASNRYILNSPELELRVLTQSLASTHTYNASNDTTMIETSEWRIRLPVTTGVGGLMLFYPPNHVSHALPFDGTQDLATFTISLVHPDRYNRRVNNKGVQATISFRLH